MRGVRSELRLRTWTRGYGLVLGNGLGHGLGLGNMRGQWGAMG